MVTRSIFCLVLFLATPTPTPAQDQTRSRFESIAARIEEELVRQEVPSLAVAVAQNGRILWEQGFGWADVQAQILATEHTRYALASVSKPMTATGLMVLVEGGEIDLDAPVDRFLGEAKLQAMVGRVEDATVRTLANHTSGLTKFYNLYFDDEPGRPPTRDEMIRRWGVLMSVPGASHEYSNLGYGVLDYIISRSAGRSFGEHMSEAVFEPLGMHETTVGIPSEGVVAVRYMPGGERLPSSVSSTLGSGAVYSSAHDLVRFGMFHLQEHLEDQRPILEDDSIDEMHRATAVAPLSFYDVGYGIGWRTWVSAQEGMRVVQHTGAMEGATAMLTFVPEKRVAIAVMANKTCFLVSNVHDLLVAEVLGVSKLDPPYREKVPSERTSAEILSAVSGTWRGAVHAYDEKVPIELKIDDSRSAMVRLGESEWRPVKTSVRNGRVQCVFAGDEKAGSEWRRWPINITLTLRTPDGEKCTGTLFADAAPDPIKGVPFGFTLWVTLERG